MNYVLDASIALAWCFSDEATPTTMDLLEQLKSSTAYVPSLWSLEVGNILIASERKKRITHAAITQFLTLISKLSIQIDHETFERGFHEILNLAYSEKLTTYDAAYLELAMRLGLPLASKDQLLCQTAKRHGVKTFS